jgi:hypothetical protein
MRFFFEVSFLCESLEKSLSVAIFYFIFHKGFSLLSLTQSELLLKFYLIFKMLQDEFQYKFFFTFIKQINTMKVSLIQSVLVWENQGK